jgi:hypothetical protein
MALYQVCVDNMLENSKGFRGSYGGFRTQIGFNVAIESGKHPPGDNAFFK